MQTEHYMANMGKLGRAERLGVVGPERVDDVAGIERQQVVPALDQAPGRSTGTGAGRGRPRSGKCHARSPDDAAQSA